MVTFVGNQEDFAKALKELVELDYAAIDAYQAAIDHLENSAYKSKLEEFKEDHERHVREVSDLLKSKNQDAPENGPWSKELLTTGKVMLANMVGDNTILQAIKSNEGDTNTAYERMTSHKNKWPESDEILKRGLQDERRHRAWLEATLS